MRGVQSRRRIAVCGPEKVRGHVRAITRAHDSALNSVSFAEKFFRSNVLYVVLQHSLARAFRRQTNARRFQSTKG